MLEHLDDPNPPLPTASTRQLVLRRAARIRRQWTLTTALCVLALVAGVTGGEVLGRGSTSNLSAAQTAYAFDREPGPVAAGVPVPTAALVNVNFASAQDGFAVALHRSKLLLAASTDGGATWHAVDSNLPSGFTSPGFVGQMEFLSSTHGYLWGGDLLASAGSSPLWVTNDGGHSWLRAPLGPFVYDLSAIGQNVWALSSNCRLGSAAVGCQVSVYISGDGGQTWQPTPAPPESAELGSPPYELARITIQRAYVLEQSDGTAPFTLAFTADGGATWVDRPVPCATQFALGAELAASSTQDLWLICGGQSTSGYQPKQLYRSQDGGQHWLLVSSASGFFGTAVNPFDSTSPLPSVGQVAPTFVGHKNLAVASPSTAWLFPFKGEVYKTTDGGDTWVPVPDLQAFELEAGGSGDITFISATQGWVCEYGVGLWHTTDGTNWKVLGQ